MKTLIDQTLTKNSECDIECADCGIEDPSILAQLHLDHDISATLCYSSNRDID